MYVCCYVFNEPLVLPKSVQTPAETLLLLLRTITILLQKEKASSFHHKDYPRRLESPRCRRTRYCFRLEAHLYALASLARIFPIDWSLLGPEEDGIALDLRVRHTHLKWLHAAICSGVGKRARVSKTMTRTHMIVLNQLTFKIQRTLCVRTVGPLREFSSPLSSARDSG